MTRPQEKRFLATQAEALAFATQQSGTFHRDVKPQPALRRRRAYYWDTALTRGQCVSTPADQRRAVLMEGFCPFGPVGARWWVAETLGYLPATNETFYTASLDGSDYYEDGDGGTFGYDDLKKSPPRHARRSDARSLFEVTSVACEQRGGTWAWVVGWRKVEK